jgi:hypothetical protein
MTTDAVLKRLADWYVRQCDGDWEHSHGVVIDTLDNPGWSLSVDLAGTTLEARAFPEVRVEVSSTAWYTCRVENGKFRGWSGPSGLGDLLRAFLDWAEE